MQLSPFEVAVFNGKHQHFFLQRPSNYQWNPTSDLVEILLWPDVFGDNFNGPAGMHYVHGVSKNYPLVSIMTDLQ